MAAKLGLNLEGELLGGQQLLHPAMNREAAWNSSSDDSVQKHGQVRPSSSAVTEASDVHPRDE